MDQFIRLYETVYKDLYRLAYYYMGNPQEAEDAVAETVLKAYEKFNSLRNKEAFKKWIFKILVNQCISNLRKRRPYGLYRLVKDESFEAYHEDRVVAEDILSVLTKDERQIVVLFVFGGYTGDEIAKLLHMKSSTVRSKYRRALRKMEDTAKSGV